MGKSSTLNPNNIKIWVSDQSDNEIESVKIYGSLLQYSEMDENKYIEKVIYSGKVNENQKNYRKDFRVRIWVDESTDFSSGNYNNKTFSITVNVYANGHSIGQGASTNAGLYDDNDNLIANWDTLVNTYGMNINNSNLNVNYLSPPEFEEDENYYIDNFGISSPGFYNVTQNSSGPPTFTKIDTGSIYWIITDGEIEEQNDYYDDYYTDVLGLVTGGKYLVEFDQNGDFTLTRVGGTGMPYETLANQELSSGTKLVLPESITTIPDSAFYQCSSLKEIIIPNSVTSIGNYAFSSSGITEITIPDSVVSLGNFAFDGCDDLNEITLGNGLTTYSKGYIAGANNLETIRLGTGITEIPSYGFAYSESLKTIVLSDSVTTLGYGAFYESTGLTSVYLGNSITEIPENAFRGCTSLETVNISNTVTTISFEAFNGCTSLENITLGTGVQNIYTNAFYNTGLKSITIPYNVEIIARNSFAGCQNLTSVTIADTDGMWSFNKPSGNNSITSLTKAELSNPTTMATYLTSTYYNYEWKNDSARVRNGG